VKTLNRETKVLTPQAIQAAPPRDTAWASELIAFIEQAASDGATITVTATERVYSPQEAAHLARVSRATILRRIEDRTLRATKHGSHWQIRESDLNQYRHKLWVETVALVANDF
jgi:excisionase family DNA binding protein